jgi:GT2 family glycosyltransferase
MTGSARTLGVCICTRNRPEDLARTIASIPASTVPVAQIVVSDDGTTDPVRELCESLPADITYVDGPRVGLGANRNAALRAVTTDLVLFLDDDCLLAPEYFERALDCMRTAEAQFGRGRVIVSGTESRHGVLICAHAQTFLGFQALPYADDRDLRSIVINATLFPRTLFEVERFDDQLVYGYDEVDLACRAVRAGFRIVGCTAARNIHEPAEQNRLEYVPFVDASRLYVTYKRYRYTERVRLRAAAYALVAPLHLLAAGVRRDGLAGARASMGSLRRTLLYLRKYCRGGGPAAVS